MWIYCLLDPDLPDFLDGLLFYTSLGVYHCCRYCLCPYSCLCPYACPSHNGFRYPYHFHCHYPFFDCTCFLLHVLIFAQILDRTLIVVSRYKLDFTAGYADLKLCFGVLIQNNYIRLYFLYFHDKRTLSNNFLLLKRVRLYQLIATVCELSYTQVKIFSKIQNLLGFDNNAPSVIDWQVLKNRVVESPKV